MKFKPGDPVWVRVLKAVPCWEANANSVPTGEHAGTVMGFYRADYLVEIINYPPPPCDRYWAAHELALRPRRDDYQQHEGLGSMDKINRPPDLNEAAIEEMCDFIRSAQKAHERS